MTALLPRLSRYAAQRDHPRLIDGLSRSLRLTSVVIAPVAAAMVVLGPQLAVLLFAHGHSDPGAVVRLGGAVAAFGLVLLPFTGYMVLLRGFYAVQDTRTPALITTMISAVGIAGCLLSDWLLPRNDVVVGVAAAYALAYSFGLVTAGLRLRRRLGRLDGRRLASTNVRMAAALVVGTAAAATTAHVTARHATIGWSGSLVVLTVAALIGAAGYTAAARLLRLSELRDVAAATLAVLRTS